MYWARSKINEFKLEINEETSQDTRKAKGTYCVDGKTNRLGPANEGKRPKW